MLNIKTAHKMVNIKIFMWYFEIVFVALTFLDTSNASDLTTPLSFCVCCRLTVNIWKQTCGVFKDYAASTAIQMLRQTQEYWDVHYVSNLIYLWIPKNIY